MPDFLTPAEAMEALRIKDRHTLDRLVARGRLERFNVSGGEKQARWKYRLKALEPEPAEVSEEELKWLDLKRRNVL
jgi:hypothetical protein